MLRRLTWYAPAPTQYLRDCQVPQFGRIYIITFEQGNLLNILIRKRQFIAVGLIRYSFELKLYDLAFLFVLFSQRKVSN